MKKIIIGITVGTILIITGLLAGIYAGWLPVSQFFDAGGNTAPILTSITATPSIIPSAESPALSQTSSTAPPLSTYIPSPSTPAAGVNFVFAIAGFSGTGFSRTVTSQITNTGNTDAHNVWVRVEVFSQGQLIQLSGQDYLKVDVGTLPAGKTVEAQTDLSFSILDGLKIQTSGADFLLNIYSDERTQTLNYYYKP